MPNNTSSTTTEKALTTTTTNGGNQSERYKNPLTITIGLISCWTVLEIVVNGRGFVVKILQDFWTIKFRSDLPTCVVTQSRWPCFLSCNTGVHVGGLM